MAVRRSITSVMDTKQGGMQVGENNDITYRNCKITTNITNIHHHHCKQCHPTEEHDPSQDTSRDLRSASPVHTTTSVRLVDMNGRELKLGDWVFDGHRVSIYAGDGMIITLDEDTQKIVQKAIDVEEPFASLEPRRATKYSRRQVVQRVKGKVGQVFGGQTMDFVCWCYKDITFSEWRKARSKRDLRA